MDHAEIIRKTRKSPLIGIVGAAHPSEEYTSNQGIEVGYAIRKYLDGNNGFVFTGGVDGVGADAYCGIVRFCIEKWFDTRQKADDRFFVLVPEYISDNDGFSQQYYPPRVYSLLARILERDLKVIRAGEDMAKRRECLAQVADVLVVVNGSDGTWDEVMLALAESKPVIALSETGGIARMLSNKKENRSSLRDEHKFRKSGFSDTVDTNLIFCARNTDEMIQYLSAQF